MNATVWIASRELRERSRLFLVAACLSVVPFVGYIALHENRSFGVATAAAFLAAAYGGGLAVALGVGTVGRELAEKRMSFFFAKPVSASSIWFGKLAASLLTIAVALIITVLPTVVFAFGGWRDLWSSSGRLFATYTFASCVVLFFGGHALSTMFRSRSARIGIDFLLLGVTIAAVLKILEPIALGGGLDIASNIIEVLVVVLLLLLAIAPAWQLANGRIDPKRNPAAFSTFVWSGMGVAVVAAALFSWWVISVPPSKVTAVNHLLQDPTGRWLFMTGAAEGRGEYSSKHLIDTTTGEYERIGDSFWNTTFSGDGKTLLWMQSAEIFPRTGLSRVYTRRLEPGAKQTAMPLVLPFPRYMAVSRDASRIAVANDERIEVYEVATGRLLASARRENRDYIRAIYFVGSAIVRTVESNRDEDPIRIRELDLVHRKLTLTGERSGYYRGMALSADGSRMYLRNEAVVLDAKTGRELYKLPVQPKKAYYGTMLADGTSIVARDAKLYDIDANGRIVAEVALPVEDAFVVGRIGTSKIILSKGASQTGKRSVLVVNLATRKVERVLTGLHGPFFPGLVITDYPDDATFGAMDTASKPLLWDARTGTKRPLPS
jgi:ABC-type transport system involved in multi-copper enzyme maturation permease subunit